MSGICFCSFLCGYDHALTFKPFYRAKQLKITLSLFVQFVAAKVVPKFVSVADVVVLAVINTKSARVWFDAKQFQPAVDVGRPITPVLPAVPTPMFILQLDGPLQLAPIVPALNPLLTVGAV